MDTDKFEQLTQDTQSQIESHEVRDKNDKMASIAVTAPSVSANAKSKKKARSSDFVNYVPIRARGADLPIVHETSVIFHHDIVAQLCKGPELMDGKSICGICHISFPCLKDLLSHSESVHNSSHTTPNATYSSSHDNDDDWRPLYFKCGICGNIYAHETDLQLHLRFHSFSYSSVSCTLCDVRLAAESERIFHEMGHKYLEDFFTCDPNTPEESRKDVKSVAEMLKSVGSGDVHGLKYFACNACPMWYGGWKLALAHRMQVHSTKEIMTCFNCNYEAKDYEDFKKHVKEHDSSRVPCPHENCRKLFSREADFLKHIERHQTQHLCELCGAALNSLTQLSSHIRTQHTSYCVKCKINFEAPAALRKHMLNHPNHMKYSTCPDCGKVYPKGKYLTHLRTHDESLRFPCTMCDKTFQFKYMLRKHMQSRHFITTDEPEAV